MNSESYLPRPDTDWPDEIVDMQSGFAGRLNVYRVMAHHPALLRAWTDLRDHVVVKTALGRQLSEVAILRTGHRLGSSYEWAHHVCRARACGMDDARIASIRNDPDTMTATDAIIVRSVDALLDTARLSPEQTVALSNEVGQAGVFDLIATVAFYSALGYILNSFDTPIDADVAAELAARPLD